MTTTAAVTAIAAAADTTKSAVVAKATAFASIECPFLSENAAYSGNTIQMHIAIFVNASARVRMLSVFFFL